MICLSTLRSTSSAGPLKGVCTANRHDRELIAAGVCIINAKLRPPAVNNEYNSRDGDRCFGKIGGNNALSCASGCWRKCGSLLFGREPCIERKTSQRVGIT